MLKDVSLEYINKTYDTPELREAMCQNCEKFCDEVKKIITVSPEYKEETIPLIIDIMLLQFQHKIDTEIHDNWTKERMEKIHETLHVVACNELLGDK